MPELTVFPDPERVNQVYLRLMREQTNPATVHNNKKRELALNLSELLEYLTNVEDRNPIDRWFGSERPIR